MFIFKNSGVLLMNKYNKSSWLYDSGAGEHLTNDKSLLINYKEEKCILKCANNSSCVFEGHGEFHFFINSHKIVLKRLLYSKEVSRNIISGIELAKIDIKALTERSDRVKLTLIDKNNNTIGTFHSNNNNEIFFTAIHNDKTKQNIKNYIFNINKLNYDSKLIWHRRLGHYYIENIDNYLNLHNIKEPLCIDRKIYKMKRKPQNKEMPKASDILEVIHSDIPINDSINGMRFVITFIDEKSHKSWIFLMKRKSEAIDIIKFLKYLNNLFNDKKVKIFKSDNAREYKNKRIISFCEDNVIAKIYSPPYNPENNGIVERFNQTLISCTKTQLSLSKLSENFWDYAITYGNYLYNKTPHQISNNNVPDECFYNRKVKLDHLRTFGCIVYYKIYDQNKSKFHSNSNKGIFLGFDEKTHSYLIMDFNNYNLRSVREIFCIEDEPANFSLSNSAADKNEYPTFLKFDFNLSKYSTINKDFYFPNNNENNSDINKNNSKNNKNNSENNKNISDITPINNDNNNTKQNNNNDIIKENNNPDSRVNNKKDNNINIISNNNGDSDDDFYSVDGNEEDNFSKNGEKKFNNKNLNDFDIKNDGTQNNNNLSSENFNISNKNNNNYLNYDDSIYMNQNNKRIRNKFKN